MRTLDEVAITVSEVLAELGIDYVIVGGIAVGAWGNVRTTLDVDIIMDLEGKDLMMLRSALKREGFDVAAGDMKDALKEKSHFTIFDEQSDFHIDVKGCYGFKEKRTLETKKAVKVRSRKIFLASAEDTIANKLVFGSEQDLKDAMGIYVRQMGKLDMKYLQRICDEIGVGEKLIALQENVDEILAGHKQKR